MACSRTSNHTASHLEGINVMFLCDEWKSSKGGLSTFNREFAVNLAKTASDSIKVHCYVSQSDEQSREDAKQHGVNLITARSIPGSTDPLDWLKIPPQELPNPDIVVGHGRKFGTPAYFIVQAAKCKWVHFVHVFCEDLGKFKVTQSASLDTIEENEKKHKSEIELCNAADLVVAVGSRLQQKYHRSLPNVKVEIITPGIIENFSSESTQLVSDRLVEKKFKVFMFGRASFEDLTLKGYDIVANAIGSLGKMYELTFVGSSPGEHRKIEQWFLKNTSISQNQLTIRSYCNDQDELKMMFHESDMVALPSRTEGFGLVALEAISSGIPVLVTSESGIAEALQKVENRKSVVVDSVNAWEWAQRIQQLSNRNPEEREKNANQLRESYNKTYSWQNECDRFKGMIQDLLESSNALRIRIDVDSMKPAELKIQEKTPVPAAGSEISPNGGHQEAAAALVLTGHTPPSSTAATSNAGSVPFHSRGQEKVDPRNEAATAIAEPTAGVLQAPNPIPTEGEILRLIASKYLKDVQPKSRSDWNDFLLYMKEMRFTIANVREGSLVITVKCDTLEALENLWKDFSSSNLDKVVQKCFVTKEILKELNLAELKLETTISEEDYEAYKMFFEKESAARDQEPPSKENVTWHVKEGGVKRLGVSKVADVTDKLEYGDVIISLENCILDEEQLKNTPSIKDGIDKEVETDLRIVGCEYIQIAGILLQLPQVAMATAQVLFQRFYFSKSLVRHDCEIYAMASIFLAAKIEESPRKIRDVINVFHHIKQKRNARTIQPMEYMGNSYFVLKHQVFKAEMRILKELGFCVHVTHPHKIILVYLQILESDTNTLLVQQAWNYMNDGFRTNVFVRYPPETISCACIFLSARQLGISLPTRPPWWELFRAKLEDLEEISLTLLSLYMRPKANLETLQKAVTKIRNDLVQKKGDSKGDEATTDGKKKKNSSQVQKEKKTSYKEHPMSRTSRRSRFPVNRRSRSRSTSPTRSLARSFNLETQTVSKKRNERDQKKGNKKGDKATADYKKKKRSSKVDKDKRTSYKERPISHSRRSRSRSRSYSISISPGSVISKSESESSDKSPDKRKGGGKRKRRSARRRDDDKREQPRKYDSGYVRKKARSDGYKSYLRDRRRERSRSPYFHSRSRSRSRSPGEAWRLE